MGLGLYVLQSSCQSDAFSKKKRIKPCLQKWRLFHLAAFSFFVAIALVNGLFWIHATKQFLCAQYKLMLRWRTGNRCSKTFLTFQNVPSVKIFILYVWNNVSFRWLKWSFLWRANSHITNTSCSISQFDIKIWPPFWCLGSEIDVKMPKVPIYVISRKIGQNAQGTSRRNFPSWFQNVSWILCEEGCSGNSAFALTFTLLLFTVLISYFKISDTV